MSVCTFIASDCPLKEAAPVQDYPLEISPFSLIFLSGTIIHKIIRITSLFAGQLFPAFKCFVTPIVRCIEIIYPNSYFSMQ